MIGDLAHEILLSAPGPNWPFRFRVGLGLGLGLGLSTIAKYCSICIILLIYLHEKKSFTLLPESLNGEVKLVPHHLEEVLHMWAGDVIVETLLILPPLQLQEGDLPRVPRVLLIDVQTDETGTVLLIHYGINCIMNLRSFKYTGICLFILVTSLTNFLLYFLCLSANSAVTKSFPLKLQKTKYYFGSLQCLPNHFLL